MRHASRRIEGVYMSESSEKRRVLLVLGMHRSGTSAVTRVVNLLGANLSANLVEPGPDNPDGFWEHAGAVQINDALLGGLGRTWYDMREMPENWQGTDAALEALEQIRALIAKDFRNGSFWAIKDPRMSLTAPLWIRAFEELGYEVDCLFVVRDPREVVDSLHVRNKWVRRPLFLMWVQYLVESESATRNNRRVLITFDDLLADWRGTMSRVADQLEFRWPVPPQDASDEIGKFLNGGRRHHVAEPSSEANVNSDTPTLAESLYQACLTVSRDNSKWISISNLEESYRLFANLYADHVDDLLKKRWRAEGRALTAEATIAKSENELAQALTQASQASLASRDVLSRKTDAVVRAINDRVENLDRVFSEAQDKWQIKVQKDEAREAADHARMEAIERVSNMFEQRLAVLDARLEEHERHAASAAEATRKSVVANTQGLQSVREEINGRLNQIQQALEQKDARIQQVHVELERRDATIRQFEDSASWRVTAPFRWLRRTLTPGTWRTAAAKKTKAMYERLPMPTHRRLAFKSAVFRTFAPVLRSTRSYRAWQAFEAHRGSGTGIGEGKSFASKTNSPDKPSLSDSAVRVLDALRMASTRTSEDYVPISSTQVDKTRIDVRAIAFYLPQFHPIPENDKWWGRGFTEWTNVSKAVPQFIGHYQPRLPGELGFYDLRVIDVMRRQVELATQYGLQGFCFHYYWFAGHRLLERPLEQFLANKDIDFPFCICWANENWSKRWDGMDQDLLIAQDHSPEDDIAFITALEPLLRDPRYIRVDGRPLIVLYRPSILPDAVATQQRWRDHCRKVGIGEIFLAMVQFDVEDPRVFGFDAAIEFPPHKLARGLDPINDKLQLVNPEYAGYAIDYGSVIERAREHAAADFDLIRGIFPSWDNEARKPGRGYTFANATPERYREWLDFAIAYARQHPVEGERLVFINAWNEWAEGAYLEPDRRFGYAYLQQTRDALLAHPSSHAFRHRRVAIISHDARPHGAQYLALHLAREFHAALGMEVEILLMDGGMLSSAFAETARVHDMSGMAAEELNAMFVSMRKRGVELVIANTAVSGRITQGAADAGLHVVSLVHELPELIRDCGLEDAVRGLVKFSDKVVVPSKAVSQGLEKFVDAGLLASKATQRPQGLFTRSKYRGTRNSPIARSNLRAKLGLSDDARIVLTVGYADKRKGVDLLLAAAAICCANDPLLHFVWVGHLDVTLEEENRATIANGNLESRIHFVGLDFQTDDYYAGADLYALTSREDPFPSVVLESMAVGTPVVAFADTGGGADLLRRKGGVVVPAFDIDKYAQAITCLLADDRERANLGEQGIDEIDAEFSFRTYAMDLLRLGGMRVPRVSVIVPNFNYARYLPERMKSIVDQTIPIYEIIFLDDGSSDESLETIQELRHSMNPEPRIVINKVNSGSVFRQWQRGVQLARGDYVWIAEADDLAKPDFLETLLDGIQADDEVSLAYCQSQAIDENGDIIMQNYLSYTDPLSPDRWLKAYVADGEVEVDTALGIKNTIPNVSGVLFKRQALLNVIKSELDEVLKYKIGGDWLIYLHMLRAGKIFFTPKVCNCHRRHRSSVTLGTASEMHYREIVELQQRAQAMFALSAESAASAENYRAHVRQYLGS
jgi:O-antigen biosynthesis protein